MCVMCTSSVCEREEEKYAKFLFTSLPIVRKKRKNGVAIYKRTTLGMQTARVGKGGGYVIQTAPNCTEVAANVK